MSEWANIQLRNIFDISIAGEWGEAPDGINDIYVLRAADFTKDCKLKANIGAARIIPMNKLLQRKLVKGDLLLEKSGGSPTQPVGRVVYFNRAGDNYSLSNFLQLLRVSKSYDSLWAYYLLTALYDSNVVLRYQQQTTGIINFKLEEYLSERINVPLGLNEQQKIAKILSTVDNLIEKTQTLIDKYTAVKQGMMADLFTRGIDMTMGDTPNPKGGKLRPSVEDAPELYKQTELGWVPKEWEVTTLENEHQIHSGSTPSRQEVERYFKNGNIQWIKTLDLNEAEIRTTEEQITQLALKESSCRLLPVNTVLIAMYGGWIQIGRTAILKAECATNQAICALIPNPEKLIPEFSMYYLQHSKEVWKKVAISTRKDPNITKSDVNRFPYLIPSLSEQNEIVLKINSINDVLKNQISSREKLKKQKKGLMQDLLTGKVRVN